MDSDVMQIQDTYRKATRRCRIYRGMAHDTALLATVIDPELPVRIETAMEFIEKTIEVIDQIIMMISLASDEDLRKQLIESVHTAIDDLNRQQITLIDLVNFTADQIKVAKVH